LIYLNFRAYRLILQIFKHAPRALDPSWQLPGAGSVIKLLNVNSPYLRAHL
jgi:hypothetical protein